VKVGGLADVSAALPKTLKALGHKVTIVMPRFPAFEEAGLLLARRLTPLTLDLTDLMVAVERVLAGILTPVLHRVVARPLDVEGATLRIEVLLQERSEIDFRDAVGPNPTIVDLLSTLLALLELAKRGLLRVAQDKPFAPMVIRRDAPGPTD